MGLELPSQLTEPLGWIGLTWPEADEELLFEAGQRWIAYGEQLAQVAQQADQVAAGVWAANEGDAADGFREWWERAEGPRLRLAEDAAAALLIGGALLAFAAVTLALKIAFIAQLVVLAIQVAQAIATAFVTFGATLAEIPVFVTATRVFCQRMIRQVLDHIQTVIKELFEQAKHLLKHTKRPGKGRHALDDGVREINGIRIPARQTIKRYEGKPLLDKYLYETDLNHPRNPFEGAVRRLTPEELEAHRIFVDDSGYLRSAADGSLFDTTSANTFHSGTGRAIFVMDDRGNMFASNYQEVGDFHHSTLSGGGPVAAAGELSVVNGRIQHATAASGHYQPGLEEMTNFGREMNARNAGPFPIFAFDGETRML